MWITQPFGAPFQKTTSSRRRESGAFKNGQIFYLFGGSMFSRIGLRIVAAVLALSMLAGCAEFNQRGGVVAEAEDAILFVAHTKSHRLFRSYLLAGVLLAAARQGGHNDADKTAIEANLKSVLDIATEAYVCLYPPALPAKVQFIGHAAATTAENAVPNMGTDNAMAFTAPALCQFFDEKMARLDYALYRLALSSLFNEKSNVELINIRDKLIGEIPVVSAAAKSAIFGVRAVQQTTTIVDDLLNLSFSSLGPVVTLLPLYRDSLELNMWVIIDNLTRLCKSNSDPETCKTLDTAKSIINDGNGDLRAWRAFVRSMNNSTPNFEAYAPHFFLVTGLMWRTCRSLFNDASDYVDPAKKQIDPAKNKCEAMLAKALVPGQAFNNILFSPGVGGRPFTVELRSPTQFARQKILPSAGALPTQTTIAPPERDSAPIGSTRQSNGPAALVPPG
jgi:hypothetical protein